MRDAGLEKLFVFLRFLLPLLPENFKFYKKVSEDDEVSKEFFARLFEWYIEGRKKTPAEK